MEDEPMQIQGRRRKIWIWWIVGLFATVAVATCGIIVAVAANLDNEPQVAEMAPEKLPTITEMIIEEVVEPEYNGTVYLTFDDGPGEHTARLLDILAKYKVKATFFVTCGGSDEMILREFNEGHTVALHTCSHNYAAVYTDTGAFFADLAAVQDRVKRITGETAMLIRFPGGSSNTVSARYDGGTRIMSRLVNEVTARGYTYFDWNLSSGDAGGTTTADEVYVRVASGLKAGGETVVLQHDIKGFSVDAVERIIQYGLANGYKFEKLTSESFTAHHGVNN